jgi:DNA-binding Xre family transcriptional regulator
MAQAARLVHELKSQLKIRGVTYRELAHELELSESAVKQMFSSGNMTLARLDRICEILALDLADLVQASESAARQLQSLTHEQEAELISDPKLLLTAYCLVNHWTFAEILRRYQLSEVEGIRYLARLDRMKLIELLPGNRVKPLIASNFTWQPDGPIEKYFRKEVQGPFFDTNFNEDGCLRLVKNGDISEVARQQIQERLHAIGQLFDDTVREERKLPIEQRQGTTMVLAIRHWMFEAFAALERNEQSQE